MALEMLGRADSKPDHRSKPVLWQKVRRAYATHFPPERPAG
jgi:hypothetical protein